jgi:hypothetical protein
MGNREWKEAKARAALFRFPIADSPFPARHTGACAARR